MFRLDGSSNRSSRSSNTNGDQTFSPAGKSHNVPPSYSQVSLTQHTLKTIPKAPRLQGPQLHQTLLTFQLPKHSLCILMHLKMPMSFLESGFKRELKTGSSLSATKHLRVSDLRPPGLANLRNVARSENRSWWGKKLKAKSRSLLVSLRKPA